MDGWVVSLIAMFISVITFLLGQLYSQRNPQALAQTVESQQRTIVNMQKQIDALEALVRARRFQLTTVIFADEDVRVESQEIQVLSATEEPITKQRQKKHGLGGMKS